MTDKKRSSWGKGLLILLLLSGAGGGWWWYSNRQKDDAPEFKTVTVARGDITQSVTANGQINAVKNVAVGTQVSGIITEIKVDFNSRVTNGQVIAQIDPSTYDQNVTQAQAEVASAKASEFLADINFKRAKELMDARLIPRAEYDKAEADLHQAQAGVQTKQAGLKRTQVDLERTTIYSPIDGMVISRNVDVGQTVAASFNTPTLFSIANDLRNMRIEAMVSEADVGGVLEGQPVNFTVDAFPTRQFKGQVSQVRFAPITNQNVVNYISVVDVNNADLKLRPGMTANTSIITAQRPGVLRVPNAALRFRPPESVVVKADTNAPASTGASTNRNATVAATGEGAGSGGDGNGGPNREEMRKRFESMSPEERAQMRERRGRSGEGGGPGSRGGGRSAPDGPVTRTVYLLEKSGAGGKDTLRAVPIKTGISDATHTEVLDGLKEGDVIVSGLNVAIKAASTGATAPPGASPFGGGGGFRPR